MVSYLKWGVSIKKLHRNNLFFKPWIYSLLLAVVFAVLGTASQALADLQLESSGSDVYALQQRLQTLGYLKTSPTGYFGPDTEQALIRFQSARGLRPDGIYGSQTRRALNFNPPYPPESSCANPNSGQVSKGRYVVIIPGNQDTLSKVKQCVNTAVLDQSGLGFYVDAGHFDNRYDADKLARMLQSNGFNNARVEFR